MGLLSIFQSKGKGASPASISDLADAVQQARLRARHRLIGAAVLLMIGVIVFPLLFETQPRPVAVDIPIEIPRKEGLVPLTMPPKTGAGVPRAADVPDPLVETADEAGREVTPPKAPVPATVLADAGAAASVPLPVTAPLQGATADKPSRFVVQAGAFADNASAKEVRGKVDKLGLKTFVETANTAEGKRIRVRVGPFNSKEEAEKILARMKAGGVSAVVLAQ